MKRIIWIAVLLMVVRCTSNQGQVAGVSLEFGTDLTSTEIGNGLILNPLVFNVAKVALKEVKFEADDGCAETVEEENEFDVAELFVVDLLTKKTFPELEPLELDPTNYCKLRFTASVLSEDELPENVTSSDPIVGASHYFEIESGGKTIFVRVDRDIKYDVLPSSGSTFALDTQAIRTLFLIFNLSGLLNGIDLNDLDEESPGVILIDDDNNDDALDIVESNLAKISLISDDDDDLELDDDDSIVAGEDEIEIESEED